MSPEEMRIKIAEACGITKGQSGAWYGYKSDGNATAIPDYLNDLNACQGMLKTLSVTQKYIFGWKLSEILGFREEALSEDIDSLGYRFFDVVNAKPEQICESFLRTLNLWIDEPTTKPNEEGRG